MIRWRCTTANVLPVTIRPPFEERANAVTARSISPASRTPRGRTSTPNDGATDWMAPHWPSPAAKPGSRMTAAPLTGGPTPFSSSSHLPLMPYSKIVKPVALPPGRARLSTKPAPTGSGVPRKHDRYGASRLQQQRYDRAPTSQDDVRRERDQFRRVSAEEFGIARAPTILDPHVAADGPTQFLQAL